MNLTDFFKENNRAAIAFSGGVDSAYLLYAAQKCGADITAYYVKTIFQPEFEFRDAARLAEELGINLKLISLDISKEEKILSNPPERCYYCKLKIFEAVKNAALSDGFNIILDGTNASDKIEERPGMKAISEMSVRSPLRECGLTKDKIRALSKEAGLFTWNKPAYACLATRIPAGERITAELLEKVEGAETELFNMGFYDFRVRIFHGAARLQICEKHMMKAFEARNDICDKVGKYFDSVFLDLIERR